MNQKIKSQNGAETVDKGQLHRRYRVTFSLLFPVYALFTWIPNIFIFYLQGVTTPFYRFTCGALFLLARWQDSIMVSVSVKWVVQVRAQYDRIVSEKWNSISMLSTCRARAADWFNKGLAMCRKPSYLVRAGHRVLLAGFSLSLYSLHVLKRDVNLIQTKNTNSSPYFCFF